MNRVRSMPHDHFLLSAKTVIMHAIFKIRSSGRAQALLLHRPLEKLLRVREQLALSPNLLCLNGRIG